MIRYLLDEHLPTALRRELLRREPELMVWRIHDPGAPAVGTLDPDLLRWCEVYGVALVTSNRRSMPVHLANHLASGGHMPGVFVRGHP